jgi:molybdopterin/thiamine biosynthesis adenylyltransferase
LIRYDSSRVNRYHRQTLLPAVGQAGQARLAKSRVLLVGCGALGGVVAEQLVRAGVGFLRIVDRDIVELTNLQRQVLFDEQDAADGLPKAIAAANRLRRINSQIKIDPQVADLNAANIEKLAGECCSDKEPNSPSLGTPGEGWGGGRSGESQKRCDASGTTPSLTLPRNTRRGDEIARSSNAAVSHSIDLIVDAVDNVDTRYLINDYSVKMQTPWIYGACVGTEGRVMAIQPPKTACLRCLFPDPPAAGELPTCDTAGVLGPMAGVIASLQTSAAMELLLEREPSSGMLVAKLWPMRFRTLDVPASLREACPVCNAGRYDFLDTTASRSITLCGRNAIQIRPAIGGGIDLGSLALKLGAVGAVNRTPHVLRCQLHEPQNVQLTVFPDGRALIQGISNPERANAIYAKFVGN